MELDTTLSTEELKAFIYHNKFIVPSGQQYQSDFSTKGFQTYGPYGLFIRNKLIEFWRSILIDGTHVFEIETPNIVQRKILENSGHVKRFNDFVAYQTDETNKEKIKFRADHLVKDYYKSNNLIPEKNVDNMTGEELQTIIKGNKLILGNPETIVVEPLNLMFSVGDSSFLRPETAQGIFVEFPTFFEGTLPFGMAQVGKSFRNEITPHPFTRLREFTQAEIEYFFDPAHPEHPYYNETMDNLSIPLLSQSVQLASPNSDSINWSLKDAIDFGIISNNIIAFYLAKIYEFALKIGLDKSKIRFREHLPNEMAHYAIQCWDLECLVDKNWLECVGCAYRGNYDLTVHNTNGQNEVVIGKTEITRYKIALNKGLDKDVVKNCYKYAVTFLNKDNDTDLEFVTAVLDKLVELYGLKKDMCEIKSIKEYQVNKIIPHVIEPSFGIDRLFYSVMSHCLKKRKNDETRLVFDNNELGLYQVALFQLSNHVELLKYLNDVVIPAFRSNSKKINFLTEMSAISIGKRYVRADQLGIKLCVTIDFETLKDNTLTIRDRNTGAQYRCTIDQLFNLF